MRSTPAQAGGGRNRAALVEKAHQSIIRGSRSFAFASSLFDRPTREKAWLLYAWCRRCDDIADDQDHGGELGRQSGAHSGAKDRVKGIRILTNRALEGMPTADIGFDALGMLARECPITQDMTDDVIRGFAMDADEWRPRTEGDMMRYCYHVAGAVGVMMAHVMGVDSRDSDTFDRACDLGLAFQLANIARDVVEDDAAGRCYLPVEWLVEMDLSPGQHCKPANRFELASLMPRMIALMDHHADAARIGAARLHFRQRWAVLSAARIYTAIGHKVLRRGQKAWHNRVVVGPLAKLGHVIAAFFEALANSPPVLDEMPRWTRAELRPVKGW
ncbi:phytoene/squalene synthase family protein [Altererythrobacter confluentis]|uniref:Phytoene/squalene synthase family protein n=1 Tax=Allopontixanthobacter confluentis TaxID=1849021 RepID=A0A6L7GFM6_9SPHN|nr:phytoene/squalene synthase family protein [Allopontixanthobacter confluentis]MXP14872.1 phytoene/squalene synthase family protein [Allopontixanthobacter confluentis]